MTAYREEWGSASAPMNTELGRWCASQRKQKESRKLDEARVAALDAIGFPWSSPSDINDPATECDWEELCARFVQYRVEHGDGQVPKKYKADPELGGWVAAVRRCRETLGDERVAQLEGLGFEWVSTRQCGSAFMVSFRELRDFWVENGHTDVPEDNGDLARWCNAQRQAKRRGLLPSKRVAYMDGIGFEWEKSIS